MHPSGLSIYVNLLTFSLLVKENSSNRFIWKYALRTLVCIQLFCSGPRYIFRPFFLFFLNHLTSLLRQAVCRKGGREAGFEPCSGSQALSRLRHGLRTVLRGACGAAREAWRPRGFKGAHDSRFEHCGQVCLFFYNRIPPRAGSVSILFLAEFPVTRGRDTSCTQCTLKKYLLNE